MTCNDVPTGATLYLDANVIVYAFIGISSDCSRLIQRCKGEDLVGVVCTHTLGEVYHKTMIAEAMKRTGRPAVTVRQLREESDLVRSLTAYSEYVENLILRSNLTIVPLTAGHLLGSRSVRERYGLLTNDSITVQVMREFRISSIATNDSDFEGVEGIRVFKPSDV